MGPFGALGFVGIVIGLMIGRSVHREREIRRHRERRRAAERPPRLVDLAEEGASCAYCSEPVAHACRACGRPACKAHWPVPLEQLCPGCADEWRGVAPRHRLRVAVLTVVALGALAGGILGAGAITHARTQSIALVAVMVALIAVAPLAFAFDYLLRTRFRTKVLPAARLTRRRPR